MSRIGENIKNSRIKAGMSLKQLAKKLGVAESFITEVELGRKIANQDFIDRISKVIGKDINDITMSFEEQIYEEEKGKKYTLEPKKEQVQDVWNDAFGSILKSVPVYGYDLSKPSKYRQLPISNNKIEGYALDKVLYLEIQDDDMIGFRMSKGDMAFGHITHEIENNTICLIERGEERVIRQIKKLDSNKLLLLSNRGILRTDTVEIKEIKVLVKLEKLEIKL